MSPGTSPQDPRPGNNHLGLRLGDKTLSLQSQNLVLLVFIIGVGLLAWERGRATSAHVDRLHASIAHLSDVLHQGDTQVIEALHSELRAVREQLLTHQGLMRDQSREERAALSQALDAHSQQSQAAWQQCVEQGRNRQLGP